MGSSGTGLKPFGKTSFSTFSTLLFAFQTAS